jgi:phosphoribosylanthranilate isomerase
LKVKICGITNKEDALMVEKLGAYAVGFIFYKKSKRYISPESASEIIQALSSLTFKVGVFVNEDPEKINKTASIIKLNTVQLHGDETPGIAELIDLHVIKSFRINGELDYNLLKGYKNVSYLFDSFSPKDYGGTGKKFNWHLIPKELNGNFILSGGISIENIEEVMKSVKPKAIDVTSSLERSPGIKDHKKVKEFFTKINSIRS